MKKTYGLFICFLNFHDFLNILKEFLCTYWIYMGSHDIAFLIQ